MYATDVAQHATNSVPMKASTNPNASVVATLDPAMALEATTRAMSAASPGLCVLTRAQPDLARWLVRTIRGRGCLADAAMWAAASEFITPVRPRAQCRQVELRRQSGTVTAGQKKDSRD